MKRIINIFKKNIKMLQIGIRFNRVLFFLQIINIFLDAGALLVTLLLPKWLLAGIATGEYKEILYGLLIYFFTEAIKSTYHYFYDPYLATENEKMNAYIINDFLEKSITLELGFFESEEAYDRYTIVSDHCCAIVHNAINTLLSVISALINSFLVISILRWMSIWMIILVLALIIFQSMLSNKQKSAKYDYMRVVTSQNRQINYLYRLFYVPQFIRDIKVNTLKEFIFNKKNEANGKIIQETKRSNKKISSLTLCVQIIQMLESFVIYGYFSVATLRQKIWIDDFIVSINAYNTFKDAMQQIFQSLTSFYENDLYITDYLQFMEEDTYIEHSGNLKLDIEQFKKIEFKDVSFKYPNTNNVALNHVSFSILRGEKVAVIGGNGAGKTTIIKLLLKLYKPDSGEILINNIPIDNYNTKSLRESMAVLFQDYTVYAFSIEDNITLGKKYDEKHIWAVLNKVGMKNKIENLPNGLKTPITSQLYENGVEISGGEAQRLAISRIYARDAKFAILDEPTSNLDPLIENELYSSLFSSDNDNTLIVISHRLNYTYKMDKIICIKNGTVVEIGNHEELMYADGFYKKLYELNTAKYESVKR